MRGPIARGTLRASVVLGLRLVVQAGTLLLVARFLSPGPFGAFAGVAALAVMLGTFSTFGTHLMLLGEASRDATRMDRVMDYAAPGTLACGAILFAVYLLVCPAVFRDAVPPSVVLVAIGLTEIVLQPLLALPAMAHLALGRVGRSQVLQTLPLGLRLGAAAIVLAMHPAEPLVAYGFGYFAASVVALGVGTMGMPAPWPSPRAWRCPSRAELRQAAGFAALNITATSPAELDKTLAARLLPLSAAGLYSAGARVIGATTLPVTAMLLSALPRLFREGHEQQRRTFRLLGWIFTAALGYSVVLAAVLWIFAPAFAWVFGATYEGIQQTIRWLCLAVPGMAMRMAAGTVLMAVGRPWMRAGFEVAGLAILAVASAAFTATLGPIGMPLGLACSEWGMAALGIACLARVYRGRQQPATTTT